MTGASAPRQPPSMTASAPAKSAAPLSGPIAGPSAADLATAAALEARLEAAGIALTMGGEPTLVPIDPQGAEWSVAADGPTKLAYARALAAELQRIAWPGSTLIYCPGKRYDGEVNPRWALRLITGRDGQPLAGARATAELVRPAEKRPPLAVTLGVVGAGEFAGHVELPERGNWDVDIAIEQDGNRYAVTRRMFLR